MKKLVLLLFVFTAFSLSVKSQNSADTLKNRTGNKKCCFKIASTSISSGVNKYRTMGHEDFEFEKPLKGQGNQNSINMNFMNGGGMGNMTSKNQIKLEIGLNPWSKKLGDYNKKRELTIGLYYSGSNLEERFNEEFASTPGDTFSFNTIKYQTDTVARITKSYVEKANVLGASVEYLFKTDPEKRLSVFTGIGIDASFALTARIYERYDKDSALVLNFYNQKSDYAQFDNGTFLGSEGTKSSVNAKATMFTSVYVPFGASLRLCKKKDIWNQFNLFVKGNVGLETAIVVGSKTHFNPFIGCAIGLKFDFK